MTPLKSLASSSGASGTPGYENATFWAYAFLNDLNNNAQMKAGWTKLLDEMKNSSAPTTTKSDRIGNFLSDNGYLTTGADVLNIIKADWWQTYLQARQPNAASDKFVQDLLADPDLATDWSVAAAKATAANPAPLNDFLQQRGYSCTAQQVSASFDTMRRHNMNFWTGLYGKTTVTPKGGSPGTGPAVILYGDADMTVGPDKILNFTYKNGVISWDYNDDDPVTANKSRGSLTFSHATEPRKGDAYVGNLFMGTLELKDPWLGLAPGVYDFYGQIGDAPDNRPGHVVTPPSVDKAPVDNLHYYLQQILFYGGLAMLGYFVGQVTGINKFVSDRFDQFKETMKERASELKDRFKSSGEGPDDPSNFNESTAIQRLKGERLPPAEETEKIDEIEKEQRAVDESTDKDVSEDSDTAEDLDELVV